jgi:hypothetical protein
MKTPFRILIKSFIKPFYKAHAGFFFFLFIIFFGAVGNVDGAGLFDFHLSVIRGTLNNYFTFLLVLFLWLLYAKKCEQFFISRFRRQEYSFLHMLSLIKPGRLYFQLTMIQILFLLPVVIYATFICVVGIYQHSYLTVGVLTFFLVAICLLGARWYLFQIQNPGLSIEIKRDKIQVRMSESPYWSIFIRYIVRYKKILLIGIKIFSCGILYAMVINQTGRQYDWDMFILFYSIGILGHGLLIHQIRDLEETRLRFYRSIPVSLFKRFSQYALLYLVILIPEIATVVLLTPKHLRYSDALLLVFFSYSMLLFLHSLLFIQFFPMKLYLKIILGIYLIIFCSLLSSSFLWLCVFLFLSSLLIYRARYYQYERQ